MAARKYAKGIAFALLGLFLMVTILRFGEGMSKTIEEENKFASGLEAAIIASSYLFTTCTLYYPLIILMGTAAYLLFYDCRSRYGMVLAFGLLLSAIPSIIAAWLWIIGIQRMGVRWESVWFFDRNQISSILHMPILFSTACLIVWFLLIPVVRTIIPKIIHQTGSSDRKPVLRKYLQAFGMIFSLLTLAMLPISLQALENTEHLPFMMPLDSEWYLSGVIHGIAGIVSGIALIAGIHLIFEGNRGKASLGALLLGSSFVGFLLLWGCIISALGYAWDWDIGSYRIYRNSSPCVILLLVISVVAIGIGILLWCNKKNKTTSTNSSKQAKLETSQHSTGT